MQDETTQVNTPPTPVETPPTQAITPEQLKPEKTFDIPAPNVVSSTTSTQNLTEDILKQYDATQAQNKAQQETDRLLMGVSGLQPQLEGQTQALQDAEKQAGVDTFRQSLNTNNSRILQLQAEIGQDDIVLAQELRNEELRDTLLPFAQNSKARIAGDAQIVRALKNAEIGVLNARSIALQGDLYLALDTAQKAVDAKYAPIKDRIATFQAQIEAMKPLADKAEKKELAQIEANTNLKFNEIERLQKEEKEVQALGLEAIQRGMNPSQVGFILGQNPSLAEASALFGESLQTPTEAEALDLENAQLQNQVLRQELSQAVGGSAVDENDLFLIDDYAQQYASTGKLPAGMPKEYAPYVSMLAKGVTQPDGRVVDALTGLPSQTLGTVAETGIVALKDSLNKVSRMQQIINNGGVTAGIPGKIGGIIPGKTRQEYNLIRDEFVDLLARARTGAVINDQERAQYEKLLPKYGQFSLGAGRDPGNQINALADVISDKLDTELNSRGVTITGYFSPAELRELQELQSKSQ